MKGSLARAGIAVLVGVCCALVPAVVAADGGGNILEFNVMTPVTGPFVGAANPIRGVNGGGLPWVIGQGHGELNANGHINIEVHGLVLANEPPVPPALRLTNPVPNFRAIVSCLSIDETGMVETVSVQTDPFPASAAGDARIEASIALPSPCVAPIVFVTSPGGAWFAATGR